MKLILLLSNRGHEWPCPFSMTDHDPNLGVLFWAWQKAWKWAKCIQTSELVKSRHWKRMNSANFFQDERFRKWPNFALKIYFLDIKVFPLRNSKTKMTMDTANPNKNRRKGVAHFSIPKATSVLQSSRTLCTTFNHFFRKRLSCPDWSMDKSIRRKFSVRSEFFCRINPVWSVMAFQPKSRIWQGYKSE